MCLPETFTPEEKQQADAFDKTTSKGVPDGLFQCSMNAIRSAHIEANRIRAGIVLAGLFTDKALYRETVTLFYLVTKELETRLAQLRETDEICSKLLSLGYEFTPQYEKDLATLYVNSINWKDDIRAVLERNEAARQYCARIRDMKSGVELAGAAFCLWGALIIGGGAVAQPRIKALWGEDATHVFQTVIGPGRNTRRQKFTKCWDSLAKPGTKDFDVIVESCRECMQGNNALIASVKHNPWWLQYVATVGVGALALGAFYVHRALLRPQQT